MAAQAAGFLICNSRHNNRIAPGSSNHGCERIAPATHQDQALAMFCLCPGGPGRPRRTLVPLRVQWYSHRFVAAGVLAPTPRWLALQATRFTARVTADGIPFRLVAGAPGPFPGLPPPSKLT